MKSPNDLDDAQGRAAERVGIAGAGLFFANREEAGKLVDLVSERNGARGVIHGRHLIGTAFGQIMIADG